MGYLLKKGDRETYFDGLKELIEKKKEYQNLKLILHTNQGSVYSSKSYNELLPLYNIVHSMSRAGTPTDNGTMESINGWLKEELFNDFHLKQSDDVEATIKEYIHFFNYERPSFSLNYLTPPQFNLKKDIQNSVYFLLTSPKQLFHYHYNDTFKNLNCYFITI